MATKLTLDAFIANVLAGKWPANAYVREPGFKQLYVRLSLRWFDAKGPEWTLDLANVEARWPGAGYFTRLITRLRETYPFLTLYVESVFEQRFRDKLLRDGFERHGEISFMLRTKAGHAMPPSVPRA